MTEIHSRRNGHQVIGPETAHHKFKLLPEMKTGHRTIGLRIPRDWNDKIDAAAAENNLSRQDIVRQMIQHCLYDLETD